MDKAYLTLRELLHRLHISDATARRLVKSGELTAYKFGGQLRFDPTDVQSYIDASRIASTG